LRFRQAVVISLACLAVLTVFYLSGALSIADLKLQDVRFRLRGERAASDRIALVAVDDATIAAYGKWPLPRDSYALLIAALEQAGAKAIGFDLLFLGPDRQDPQYDALLAAVTASYPNVVHAVAFLSETSVAPGTEDAATGMSEALLSHGLEAAQAHLAPAAGICLPSESLIEASAGIGHTTVSVDRDGSIRRIPLLVRFGDRLYPSLGLRLSWFVNDGESAPALEVSRDLLVLKQPDGRAVRLPYDQEGATPIDFAGDRYAFPHSYGMLEVLRWFEAGDTTKLADTFGGRIVLIGNTAVGQVATDVGTTPFATMTPLVYVHANVLDAVLSERFMRGVPHKYYFVTLVVLCALLSWLFVTLSLPVAAGVMVVGVAGVALLEYALFLVFRVNVPSTLPLLLVPLVYATTASYRFVFLERRTREQEGELKAARTIQLKLLPEAPPELPDLDLYGTNIAAKEVGGDYYDWVLMGGEFACVVIGDVSGKGVSASLLMSHLHASFHAETRLSQDPKVIIENMNVSLFRATELQRFATFFLALISRKDSTITYCNAGHGPVLLVSGEKTESLGPTGVPLGIFETAEYGKESREFKHGDVLLMCSDGISECECHGHGVQYGEGRLDEVVRAIGRGQLEALAGARSPKTGKEIADFILADVRTFCRGRDYADDVTIVVVRRR
jgi:serine phosphatase RsbU (regulator of sigma subunit)